MGHVVKTFEDGAFVEYDRGSFDEWCVYITDKDNAKAPPRDRDYFTQLQELSKEYGVEKIYSDFVSIYEKTGKKVNDEMLEFITSIASTYGEDSLVIDKLFTILYMAMIAEECKRNTKLGRRIKRLGLHVLLMEGRTVEDAANFMKGMKWREIDKLCAERGF